MSKALLLVNPTAGRRRFASDRLDGLLDRLARSGLQCQPVLTRPGPQPVPPLDCSGKDLIIVCGGDGTLHQALPQLLPLQLPLGLIPSGTANVLARELKIPLKPEGALRVLKAGKTRPIHLGQCGGSYFHLMAGIGLDGYIISRVGPLWKRSLGSYSYWLSGLSTFWKYPLPEFEVDLDGESHRATFAVVSKVSSYGGHLIMAPQASPFEPCLDVCLFTSRRHRRFLRYLSAALRGRHLAFPDVLYRKTCLVEVRGQESIQVQMDGELAGRLPMSFSIASQTLQIIVP